MHPRLARWRSKITLRRARKLLTNPLLPLQAARARVRKARMDPHRERGDRPERLATLLDASPARLDVFERELQGEDGGFRAAYDARYRRLEVLGDLRLTTGRLDAGTLYVAVRALEPDVVVATGSRFGAFDAHVAAALEHNDRGHLHVVDLPGGPEAFEYGYLVPEPYRHRWHLHEGDVRDVLPDLLDEHGPVGVFLHDSVHTEGHMAWEFATAAPHVTPGGIVASHDVLLHDAFARFADERDWPRTRVWNTGIARRPR